MSLITGQRYSHKDDGGSFRLMYSDTLLVDPSGKSAPTPVVVFADADPRSQTFGQTLVATVEAFEANFRGEL